MSHRPTSLQLAMGPACGGLWRLAAGRAVQLRPRQASTFKLVCGQVWATTDGAYDRQPRRLGDHVLSAGDTFAVMPGERLVVETWGSEPVRFDWVVQAPVPAVTPSRWQAEVAAPGRELAQALAGTAAALGRLVWGVAGYTAHLAGFLVAGRGRVLSHFESNPP
jgi:hypothetical protein